MPLIVELVSLAEVSRTPARLSLRASLIASVNSTALLLEFQQTISNLVPTSTTFFGAIFRSQSCLTAD